MSDAAITVIVSGLVQVVVLIVGFLTLWVKLKFGAEKAEQVERKVDQNTILTVAGQTTAAADTKAVAIAATSAVDKMETIAEQLNGKLDAKITAIVKAHMEPIMTTMHDLKNTLNEIGERVKRLG